MPGCVAACAEGKAAMWLDDLNELVGTLKERIEQHKDVLG